jgi:hypothetical protein
LVKNAEIWVFLGDFEGFGAVFWGKTLIFNVSYSLDVKGRLSV